MFNNEILSTTEQKEELKRIKKAIEELEKEQIRYPELEELKKEATKKLLEMNE